MQRTPSLHSYFVPSKLILVLPEVQTIQERKTYLPITLVTQHNRGELVFLNSFRVMNIFTYIISLNPHTKLVRDSPRLLFTKVATDV